MTSLSDGSTPTSRGSDSSFSASSSVTVDGSIDWNSDAVFGLRVSSMIWAIRLAFWLAAVLVSQFFLRMPSSARCLSSAARSSATMSSAFASTPAFSSSVTTSVTYGP